MNVVRELHEIEYRKNSVVTVGTFDGIHRGHRVILEEVVEKARRENGRSVVVTFDPHPRQVLKDKRGTINLLSSLEERQQFCAETGIDLFYIINFTYDFSRQDFREFYEKYIINGVGVSEVVEGYDHHFGRDREGSIEALVQLGKEFSFGVHLILPVSVDNETVSSSRIRTHLREGRVDRAAKLLGRPYSLKGTIVRGAGRGRSLGYPTANILPVSPEKLIPQNGIYFVEVAHESDRHHGMASIGVRPTFDRQGKRTIEVNVLDFEGDLYGSLLEISFLKRLRDELKFDTAEELVQQMHRDKEESLRLRSEITK